MLNSDIVSRLFLFTSPCVFFVQNWSPQPSFRRDITMNLKVFWCFWNLHQGTILRAFWMYFDVISGSKINQKSFQNQHLTLRAPKINENMVWPMHKGTPKAPKSRSERQSNCVTLRDRTKLGRRGEGRERGKPLLPEGRRGRKEDYPSRPPVAQRAGGIIEKNSGRGWG